MTHIKGTIPIDGQLAPQHIDDTYPVFDQLHGLDGLVNMPTIDHFSGITKDRRRQGMIAGDQSTDRYYRLKPSPWSLDQTDWIEAFWSPTIIQNKLEKKYDKSGGTIQGDATVAGDLIVSGTVDVFGSASTFVTKTIQTEDNNIELNLSGNQTTATGGGITILSGQPDGSPSSLVLDNSGNWIVNKNAPSGITGGHLIKYDKKAHSQYDKRTLVDKEYVDDIAFSGVSDDFLPLTGGTVIGDTYFNGNLSGDTLYSGDTELSDIIKTISSSEVAGDDTEIQFNSGGTHGADNKFKIDYNNIALTLGTRSGGLGIRSFGGGGSAVAGGNYSMAFGWNPQATRRSSFALGEWTLADSSYAFAVNYYAKALGEASFAGGRGEPNNFNIRASGLSSFNFSENTVEQISNAGANADNSFILGGLDHNVDPSSDMSGVIGGDKNYVSGSTRSVVLAGSGITAVKDNTAYVENLEIQKGLGKYDAKRHSQYDLRTLVDKEYVDIAFSPGGDDKDVQFNLNDTKFSGDSRFRFDYSKIALTFGFRSGSKGERSAVIGGLSPSKANQAIGDMSLAIGKLASAEESTSFAGGEGYKDANKTSYITAGGSSSFIFSQNTSSQTQGNGALADRSFILGGQDLHIGSSSEDSGILGGIRNKIDNVQRSVIIGGLEITANTSDTVYVPNFNINYKPDSGSTSDGVLVRSTDGEVKTVSATSISNLADTFTTGSTLKSDAKLVFDTNDSLSAYSADLGRLEILHTIPSGRTKNIQENDMYLIWGDLNNETGSTINNDGRLVVVNGGFNNDGTYNQSATGSLQVIRTDLDYILGWGNRTNGKNIFWTPSGSTWSQGDSLPVINSAAGNALVTKEWVNSNSAVTGDTLTTSATLESDNRLIFDTNDSLSAYSADLSSLAVAGNDKEVQFNSGGTHGASSAFTFDSSSSKLTVDGEEEITGSLSADTINLTSSQKPQININIFNSMPSSIDNGDMWVSDDGGSTFLNIQVSGTTKSVELS